MSSNLDQANRSLEEKTHVVKNVQTTAGAADPPEFVSATPQTEIIKETLEPTLSSTLAEETLQDCLSDTLYTDAKKPLAKSTYNLRGRKRSK